MNPARKKVNSVNLLHGNIINLYKDRCEKHTVAGIEIFVFSDGRNVPGNVHIKGANMALPYIYTAG